MCDKSIKECIVSCDMKLEVENSVSFKNDVNTTAKLEKSVNAMKK